MKIWAWKNVGMGIHVPNSWMFPLKDPQRLDLLRPERIFLSSLLGVVLVMIPAMFPNWYATTLGKLSANGGFHEWGFP